MASILALEPISEESPEIEERNRVLIAAAVAAVAGPRVRILEIRRAVDGSRRRGEDRRPYMQEIPRAGSRSRDGGNAGGRWI
jgi:hypothetical protein